MAKPEGKIEKDFSKKKKSLCFLVKFFEVLLILETFDQLCSEPGVRKGIMKIQCVCFLFPSVFHQNFIFDAIFH